MMNSELILSNGREIYRIALNVAVHNRGDQEDAMLMIFHALNLALKGTVLSTHNGALARVIREGLETMTLRQVSEAIAAPPRETIGS